jgi:iron uptake system EfeUOB component EfeO/EfeM
MKLRDVFLAGNFVESLPANGSRYVTDLYQQAKEIEEAYGSWRQALKQGDMEKAREIYYDEREKIVKYKTVEAVKRIEAKLSVEIHRIERSDMSAGEKRMRIDTLMEQKDRAARRITAVP